jgi:hypothetical protein
MELNTDPEVSIDRKSVTSESDAGYKALLLRRSRHLGYGWSILTLVWQLRGDTRKQMT